MDVVWQSDFMQVHRRKNSNNCSAFQSSRRSFQRRHTWSNAFPKDAQCVTPTIPHLYQSTDMQLCIGVNGSYKCALTSESTFHGVNISSWEAVLPLSPTHSTELLYDFLGLILICLPVSLQQILYKSPLHHYPVFLHNTADFPGNHKYQ